MIVQCMKDYPELWWYLQQDVLTATWAQWKNCALLIQADQDLLCEFFHSLDALLLSPRIRAVHEGISLHDAVNAMRADGPLVQINDHETLRVALESFLDHRVVAADESPDKQNFRTFLRMP